VCWPWFNAHPADSSKPQHGFARDRFWGLTAAEDDPGSGTTLAFELVSTEETREFWPHEFATMVRIHVGAKLTVSLQTVNTGALELTVGGALHTYLGVGGLETASIEGLDGSSYLDTVGERTERTQSGSVMFSEEVDRIYRSPSTLMLRDPSMKRVITVEKSGSKTSVIWNPWIEKAKRLADLPDDGYLDFVCMETANALEDVYMLRPGEHHVLQTRISVERAGPE
jgi:D-hexose-6-phosphate mutarotase